MTSVKTGSQQVNNEDSEDRSRVNTQGRDQVGEGVSVDVSGVTTLYGPTKVC